MANAPAALGEFIVQLKQAQVVPRPASTDWAVHIQHIIVPGRVAVINEEEWDYWLDVLPPKWMHGGHFCFAEGAEAFRLFWYDRPSKQHVCRQLTWDETVKFCRLAGISLPW